MSRPSNRLAKFRSYSYYHVLAICDSTSAATALSSSASISSWSHSVDGDNNERYAAREIKGMGKYCILINGSTDSSFSIIKATWTTATAASATVNDRGTSIAVEGTLHVSEPRGVLFLNEIINCCNRLGIHSSESYWVLKTFFVGYPSDTDGEVEHITDIPPIMFLVYDVVGNFGVEGGEYEINFVALANSAARLPHFSKLPTSVNITLGSSLLDSIERLQTAIQDNYKNYTDCMKKQLLSIPGVTEDTFVSIEYKIEVEAPYTDTKKYSDTLILSQNKNRIDCGPESTVIGKNDIVHITVGTPIEEAIKKVTDSYTQVQKDASEGDERGNKYIIKILSGVEKISEKGGDKKQVWYKVIQSQVPASMSFDSVKNTSPDNIMEFDYLYTGKNIDILDFDIKMNMGMAFVQSSTMSAMYAQPGQSFPTKMTSISGQSTSILNGQRSITLYAGNMPKGADSRASTDLLTTSQFQDKLSKYASLESTEASLKIAGNSQLLGSLNKTTNPEIVRNRVSSEGEPFSDWLITPSFVKINIKTPRNNDDFSLFTGAQTNSDDSGSTDYAVDFWFKGYYYVFGIEHTFDTGVFTQTLQLLGIAEHKDVPTTDMTDRINSINATLSALDEKCFEHDTGCIETSASSNPTTSPFNGSSPGKSWQDYVGGITNNQVFDKIGNLFGGSSTTPSAPIVVLPEKHESTETPEAKQEAVDTGAIPRDLNNISGYANAKDSVKEAIHAAVVKANANRDSNTPVDEFTLVQLLSTENGTFNPSLPNQAGSSAVGLGQFMPSTFYSLLPTGNITDPEDNAYATILYMDQNRRTLFNLLGRLPTTGELYLAHWLGTGGATEVLTLIKNGNPSAPIYGNDPVANRVKDTTAMGYLNTATARIQGVLKNGVTHADTTQLSSDSGNVVSNRSALSTTKDCIDKQQQEQKSPCARTPTPMFSAPTGTIEQSIFPVTGGDFTSPLTDEVKKAKTAINELFPSISSAGGAVSSFVSNLTADITKQTEQVDLSTFLD